MLNQIIITGRLTQDPQKIELEDGKKVCIITVAVTRAYKNIDGEYETDFIDCELWNGVADMACEYCHKGDLVGVKGRIQTTILSDGKKKIDIMAEKVSFLSSKREGE